MSYTPTELELKELQASIGKILHTERKAQKIGILELARLSGLTDPTVRKIERGQLITLTSLRQVCLGLNLSLTNVITEAIKENDAIAVSTPDL